MVEPPCQCSYNYSGIEVEPHPWPSWMADILQKTMPLCGITATREWPNSCNLNLYADGNQTVGWHADNEALFQGAFQDCAIISLSLGQTRRFEMCVAEDGSAD